MAKTKAMGTEYQIIAKGTWEQVADASRITKEIIKETQPRSSNLFDDNYGQVKLENKILTGYLPPQEGDSFADYKTRINQIYLGTGIIGKIASLFKGDKIQFYFNLILNDGESTLKIESVTRERQYQATINASGDFSKRGASIATGLKEALERDSIQHSYKTIDKLI